MKIQKAAKKPVSIGQTWATNEVISQATSSSSWKAPDWTLVPVDLPIDYNRTRKRKRAPREKTVKIPLKNTEPLTDPRGPVPTPITDEDARMLEQFLEPEPQSSPVILIRVSSLWKNHGNLENEKNFFQTWKNHGISKKPQKPGKIMEFRKINLEKSWNFVSDLKLCESNFLRAKRAFQLSVIHAFVHFIVVQ